jgi:dipeptide/tripeptide permease
MKNIVKPSFLSLKNGISMLIIVAMLFSIIFGLVYYSSLLYLTNNLDLPFSLSMSTVALFIALNGAIHLIPGLIGKKWFSFRNMICFSLGMQIIGSLIMAVQSINAMYIGLTIFTVAYGLIVTSIYTLIEEQFDKNIQKKAAIIFTYSYLFLNVGLLIGSLVAGFYISGGEVSYVFYFGAFSNLLALIIFIAYAKHLKQRYPVAINIKNTFMFLMIFFAVIMATYLSFKFSYSAEILIIIISIGVFFGLIFLAHSSKSKENKRNLVAFIYLAIIALVFWSCYYVIPLMMIKFFDSSVTSNIFGIHITAPWIGTINSAFVIVMVPVYIYCTRDLSIGFYKAMLVSFVLFVNQRLKLTPNQRRILTPLRRAI